MKILKLLLMNIGIAISALLYYHYHEVWFLFIALELNVIMLLFMDNALSVLIDSQNSLKTMFIELLEKLSKEYDSDQWKDANEKQNKLGEN